MEFSYSFPAVKGSQAGKEYYVSMVPLKLLSKLFSENDEYILPEYRAQRRINEGRIPEIKKYILNNRTSYVFSALSASIDGRFRFVEVGGSNIGRLEVDMNAVFLINDGQHRKAAIEAAIHEEPSLGDETISIVFFEDAGLARSQQMFTDLNKNAVKTSNSLSALYDTRDDIAVATKKVIENNSFFRRYTDKERDILGKNSSKLFTLNSIYKANQRVLKANKCSNVDIDFLIDYWQNVSNNITEWNELLDGLITKKDLRENYIITLSVTLNALGRLGAYFYTHPHEMEKHTKFLRKIEWARSAEYNWKNRTIRYDGRVMSNEEAILLTCNKIKLLVGLSLTEEEQLKENKFDKLNS